MQPERFVAKCVQCGLKSRLEQLCKGQREKFPLRDRASTADEKTNESSTAVRRYRLECDSAAATECRAVALLLMKLRVYCVLCTQHRMAREWACAYSWTVVDAAVALILFYEY